MVAKAIQFVKDHESDIILAIGVLLISLLSFAAGYLAAKEQLKEPIRIEQASDTNELDKRQLQDYEGTQ